MPHEQSSSYRAVYMLALPRPALVPVLLLHFGVIHAETIPSRRLGRNIDDPRVYVCVFV